jgi:hypothetical protein
MSCFGTVIAVCSVGGAMTQDSILKLLSQPPIERFMSATIAWDSLNELRLQVYSDSLLSGLKSL